MSTVVTIWAVVCLAVAIALAVSARRIGRSRAGAWLVVLGLAFVVVTVSACARS